VSFDVDEQSQSDSQPREFFEITHGVTSYYVASGDRDVLYNGNNFAATPSARSEWMVNPLTGADGDMILTLPARHALAQRYVALGGVPPKQILLTARRKQLTSGEVLRFWQGYVTGVAFERHLAKFRIPERNQQSLQRRLPTVRVDTTCRNVLYDSWCQVARATFTVSTAAAFVDGRVINVGSVGGNPDQWAQRGELVHVASGESMMITSQVGVQLTLQYPIPEMKAGDSVQVVAGCDHSIATCVSKFSNAANYSGLPQRPTRNLFLTTGLGVEEYR
jgi:uncharacterized phage protein (TIGR02218 family)